MSGTLALVRSNANGFSLGSSSRACLHHAANEIEALIQTLEKIRPVLVSRSVVLASQEGYDKDELAEIENAIITIDDSITRVSQK